MRGYGKENGPASRPSPRRRFLGLRGQDQIGQLWPLYCKLGCAHFNVRSFQVALPTTPPPLLFLCSLALWIRKNSLGLDLPPSHPTSLRARAAWRAAFQTPLKQDIPSSALKHPHRQHFAEEGVPSEKLKCKCVTRLGTDQPGRERGGEALPSPLRSLTSAMHALLIHA